MIYTTYKRFKGKGIDGSFNLKYGTKLTETNGFLKAGDGRIVCAATSENGWEHFHPDTEEGHARQAMLEALYKYYGEDSSEFNADTGADLLPPEANSYWKNVLRTMKTERLKRLYEKRINGVAKCTK